MPDHATAERRSRRYHAVIAERIARDPLILQRAYERVARWEQERSVAEHYILGWREVLRRSSDGVRAFITETSEQADAFRQVSPFTFVLSPQERWKLWAAAKNSDDAPAT